MNHPSFKKLEEFTVVLFIMLSGFFTTAVFKLNNFYTFPSLDEMLWHLRSRVFWDKMLDFDFSGLIQSAQPGITVYWFTGFLMKFINFDFTDVTRRIAEKEAEGLDFNNVVNANDPLVYKTYETISFAFNAPLFLLTVVFFIIFYYLIKKLGFGRIIASFSLLFLVTNVFLVYWNTPSDKMLNIFITLSFLTLLVYVDAASEEASGKKAKLPIRSLVSFSPLQSPIGTATRKHVELAFRRSPFRETAARHRFSIGDLASKKYLILSAVFGAWAVLSKLSALFILPFYFFVLVFYAWPLDKKKMKSIFKDYLLWIIVFVFVSVIFLPSIITNPNEVYKLIFKSEYVIESDYQAQSYFSRFLFDYFKLFTFVIVGYMAQGSFLSLIAYFVLRLKKKYKYLFDPFPSKHIKTIGAYTLLFVIIVSLISKNHDIRFMSPAFVMINIFSAMGLYGTVEAITKSIKLKSEFKKFFYTAAILVIIFSQIAFIVSSGTLADEAIKFYLGSS